MALHQIKPKLGPILLGGLLVIAVSLGMFLGQRSPATPVTPIATYPSATVTLPPANSSPSITTVPPTVAVPTQTSQAAVPTSFLIKNVPFIPQAPFKNWDAVHEETCEEASALTLVHYLHGDRLVPAQQIEDELQTAIKWETEQFGSYEDETAAQTAELLASFYGLGKRVRLIKDATLHDLRREIASGQPVLVPAAGRVLGNKYFKTPGPIYHMTVAIGYDTKNIITNDPGTQHGKNYRYPIDQFWNAVHDFVDRTDEGMASGAKVLIVVDPA